MEKNHTELVMDILAGSERALARLITLVETDVSSVPKIMEMVSPYLGKAYCLGVTGFLGVGKSTLVDGLTTEARSRGLSIGIIAVDPSSVFSGGALLGDRIRMQQHYLDSGVFIRSMATRGSRGGLSEASVNVVNLLDAFGKDVVIVETIGVGQTDIDIRWIADTVVFVLVPEAGDTIQFMKGGSLEIADIVVVNKADHIGATEMVSALRTVFSRRTKEDKWQVPVLTTQAVNGAGIKELYQEVENHRMTLEASGRLSQWRRITKTGVGKRLDSNVKPKPKTRQR